MIRPLILHCQVAAVDRLVCSGRKDRVEIDVYVANKHVAIVLSAAQRARLAAWLTETDSAPEVMR